MNSINRTARFAGLLYLLVFPLSLVSLYVTATLVVPGDADTTVENIMAAEGLFRIGIVSWLIGQAIFIVLPLVLYKLLKPVNKNYAVLMVALILVAIPIAFINELNNFAVMVLLSGADDLPIFVLDQLPNQVMFFLELHEHGLNIAQILWGLWLLPLGYLVYQSTFLPRILGILLMIGCFGYVTDFLIYALFPNVDMSISQFTFIGELLFPLWLIIKGVNVEKWQQTPMASLRLA